MAVEKIKILGAEYSFYVKSIATYAPTFLRHNNSVLAIIKARISCPTVTLQPSRNCRSTTSVAPSKVYNREKYFLKYNSYTLAPPGPRLKVRKSQNKNVVSWIFQKCSEVIARISALASKMGQIRKIKAQDHAN